jgi:parallel beta-helix repeat protein
MSRVRDFGAVGDGRRDDTAALQHALDDGDGTLELGPAVYRITRPLVIDLTKRGPAAVIGQGGTSRIVMAGAGPALRIVGDHRGTADPPSFKPQTWERERFPTVQGIEIVGDDPEAVGIELKRTMQATISRVLVRLCKYAVHLVERNRNFLMANCHLYDNSHFGLFAEDCNWHQGIIHGNHISYNQRAGIKMLNGDVHNIQITGNDIEYNRPRDPKTGRPLPEADAWPAADVWFEAPTGTISEITLASNTIQATVTPGGANVRIDGKPDDWPRGARLIAITGNVIGSQERAIQVRHALRVTVTGNTIYDSRKLSLDLEHCAGLAISGNTLAWNGLDSDPPSDGILLTDCENAVISGLSAQRLCYGADSAGGDSGGGITLVRCRDTSVTDCQVMNPLVRGIELVDCERCRVAGNNIIDQRPKATMRQAIRIRGKSRHNLVTGNIVGTPQGRREKLIDVEPAAAAEVRDNVEAAD